MHTAALLPLFSLQVLPGLTHGLDGSRGVDILSRWIRHTSLTIQQGLHSQHCLVIHSCKETQAWMVNHRLNTEHSQAMEGSCSLPAAVFSQGHSHLLVPLYSTAFTVILKRHSHLPPYTPLIQQEKGRRARKARKGPGFRHLLQRGRMLTSTGYEKS